MQTYRWNWKGKPVQITYEILGEGQPILLLPAFSTVSSRTEMRGLAELLATEYQVFALDWPGFGQSDRPALQYKPAFYQGFLRDFVQATFSAPVVVIAAGHAAGYVMKLAQQQPPLWSWVVLVAPTWRGPLPTAMGEHRRIYRSLQFLVNLPFVGQFLYLLNTFPGLLYLMYRRHVYASAKKVTRSLIWRKWQTTQRWGARFASVAFVTGALDPVRQRDDFMAYFQPLPVPVLVAIGEQTPPKSRREMEFLAHFSGAQVCRLPGSLGLHEENPDLLIAEILPFMRKYLS
ncbi:alpha/beta hydrolase [Leptolyngbya sp. 'hensonii']|uniref:alpha/beta fold hydrolase n=1 Tax=Leptolyngbya sp. 'hensonii' TaxID=1922337 RepID=UPI00209BB2CC|nr:alpha/beta hydrolase [Leptolyngbya sp. 'hensonii']